VSLTFGSLFAGIGGLDLGLERAGMQCQWQVELDDYASKVLAKHWPNTLRFRDVRTVGAHNLPAVDLVCGGFPCQDISNAGKRAGIDGERSGLWREFHRIVCELRPRYVLVENVAALLGRGIDRVLGDLAASGYDAEWQCIPAAAVGAPHIRDRLFILAYADSAQRRAGAEGRNEFYWSNTRWQETPGGFTARSQNGRAGYVAHANSPRLPQRNEPRGATAPTRAIFTRGELERVRATLGRQQWEVEPAICRVADGVPRRVDRLRGLGNAVVPQVAEFIGKLIVEHNRSFPQ
jgi:DNA (cytosine-5)-methyltransferase 1